MTTSTTESLESLDLLVPLEKLTKKQRIAVYEQIDAYDSFWDHIKFRKGWAEVCTATVTCVTGQPFFTKEEASVALAKVAEIVVRIRTELDAHEGGLKLRQLEGTTKEYLWQMQEEKRRPSDSETEFTKGMVHATFKVCSCSFLFTARMQMVTLRGSPPKSSINTFKPSPSSW
jgi:hypothetical protein